MKYIKTFEKLNEPQVGDYVVCDISDNEYVDEELVNFICNNIGVVEYVDDRLNNINNKFKIRYKNVPERLEAFFGPDTRPNEWDNVFRYVSNHYIKFYSSNREDCEMYLDSKKYNL